MIFVCIFSFILQIILQIMKNNNNILFKIISVCCDAEIRFPQSSDSGF